MFLQTFFVLLLVPASVADSSFEDRYLTKYYNTPDYDTYTYDLASFVSAMLLYYIPLFSTRVTFRYEEWKKVHGIIEEGMQPWFSNFERNFALVQAHNKRFKQGLETYELDINYPWAHLTQEEFSKKMGGFVFKLDDYERVDVYSLTGLEFPKLHDLRLTFCINAAKEQRCNISWAYSAVSVLEINKCLANGEKPTPNISPQMFADCMPGRSGSCKGGAPVRVFEYVQRTGKCSSEADYPVTGKNQTCRPANKPNVPIAVKVLKIQQLYSEAAFKEALLKYGAISVATCSAGLAFFPSSNGTRPYNPKIVGERCNKRDHSVTVVGWGETNEWLVLNSWGFKWGSKGYFTVPFSKAQWLRFYDHAVVAQVA